MVQINFDSLAAHESIYGREKLDVRYEDDDLAVVVKPAGKTMVAVGYMLPFSLHPTGSTDSAQEEAHSTGGHETITTEDGEHSGDDGDDGDDEDFHLHPNISPTLGQQQRFPCAVHGLEKASNGLVRHWRAASTCGPMWMTRHAPLTWSTRPHQCQLIGSRRKE